ncbi:MAG: S8 family serine peptidase [Firmicutes bacterium]|nr:S8 family serine peptidase [Bacillota bacterium]
MRKSISMILAVLMIPAFTLPAGTAFAEETATDAAGEAVAYAEAVADPNVEYADDQLIVAMDEGLSNRSIRREIGKVGSVADITETGDQKMVLVDLNKDDLEAADILESGDKAIYVQPNYRYRTEAEQTGASAAGSDPLLDPGNSARYQYYIDATNAEGAWDLLEQGEHAQTLVGVVDTGVDSRHEDLLQNLVTMDADRLYRGYILGEEQELDDDTDEHGTHVSGIIGADFGNGAGGSGIASGHNNDLVKVITTSAAAGESLYTYDICRAIDYNVEQGARVINMSFGGTGEDIMLERCIREHYDNDQTVFVAASGNDGSNTYSTPCDFTTVIAVNAADRWGNAAYFSDFGRYKDISAPGVNIMSTLPGDNYGMMSGTSMASPATAGICGLVLDANPNLTPAQVKNILCATTKESQEGKGFDKDLAYGNVDAEAAVKAAMEASDQIPAASLCIKEDEATEKTVIEAGQSFDLTALVQPATSLAQVIWSSGDEEVAKVDETGKVTGLAPGKTEITASCSGLTSSVAVTVKAAENAEQISIGDKKSYEEGIISGTEGQFNVSTQPAGAKAPSVIFESSDNNVLFVDGPGYFVAKDPGTAVVRMLDVSGNLLDELEVTVRQEVGKVVFTKQTKMLEIGMSYTFGAKAVDEDEKDGIAPYRPEIIWSCSNGNGSIDAKGKFTAKKAGYCFVIAKADSGAYKACKVQILKKNYSGADYALKAKAKKAGKNGKKAVLQWSAIPGAVKYQIQKKTAGGKWKTVKTVKKTKYTDSKLKKTSSYRVRAYYSKFGKTGYYGWSKSVKVKVKAKAGK